MDTLKCNPHARAKVELCNNSQSTSLPELQYVQVHCTRQPNNTTLNSSVYTVPMSRVNAGSPTAVLALQKALLSEEGSVHVSNVDLLYTDRRGSPT